jgi:hypothetical protein
MAIHDIAAKLNHKLRMLEKGQKDRQTAEERKRINNCIKK